MASVSVDPVSNQFHIRFRFAGQAFKRSLKTANLREATAALARVEETLSLLQRGVLELPADADPATFLLSAGKTKQRPQKAEKALTLGQLIDFYLKSLPEQAKEKTTLKTEATHIKHFRARLPMSKLVDSLTTNDVQQFINLESRRKIGTKFISPDTIKRHMDTLKCILNWAVKQELVKQVPTLSNLVFGKRDEKLPFMMRAEIEAIIARGGIEPEKIKQLWDSLYLNINEVQEVLELVGKRARYPFLYPMFVFVAYTGVRRSEMMRATIDDFDLENGTVLIRERKRSRSRSTTYRRVELPSRCISVMKEWFADHPGGQYAFCQNFGDLEGAPEKPLTADQARIQFRKTLKNTKWSVIRGFHVFRHSYASNLATKQVDQRIIDKHMGHQTEEMRQRYQHLSPDSCKRAVESLVK
ncbi:MAG TPA: tyrosine-type recombinase/integrase [Planctomycetaceae bacterium]|nr:tyrosine-type recombinase/integrase [Planctomycetaceae bacterium]